MSTPLARHLPQLRQARPLPKPGKGAESQGRTGRRLLPHLLALTALLLLVGCGGSADRSGDAGEVPPLVVGMELSYPPFEMRGPDNQPDGISVRLAEDLAEELGRRVEIRDIEFDGLIPSLQSGRIDLIIASMTHTEEREEAIAFSDGYVTNGLCMLVAKDGEIHSPADLREGEHRVAVKLATTGHQWARSAMPGLALITLNDAASCVLEVVQGRADAFIYDQISIYQFWKRYEAETRPILEPIRSETWAIGLRHGEPELLSEVNAFLARYRERGAFEALADRYMAEERAEFERLGVPFIFH